MAEQVEVLEGKCPRCKGNVLVERHRLACEDCDYEERVSTLKEYRMALNKADTWGPKEKRHRVSQAAELLITHYKKEDIVEDEEAYYSYLAQKGMLDDPKILSNLKERGFIIE